MKSKTIIVGAVVALLLIGGAVFYLVTKEDSDTAMQNTGNSSQETKQTATETISLSDALAEIGATGPEGPVNGTTYTFNGIEYKFDVPSNWDVTKNLRKQACDQGYVNASYQIATDGSTWAATTDYNENYSALVEALKGTGINAQIASYCP